MATSLMLSLFEHPIPPETLAYFQERLRNRLHQLVLREFVRQETLGLTKKELALRIGKKPEQITRWLGAPGNWTLDTVSDLLLGMGGEPREFEFASIVEKVAAAGEQPPFQAKSAATGARAKIVQIFSPRQPPAQRPSWTPPCGTTGPKQPENPLLPGAPRNLLTPEEQPAHKTA